MCTVYPMKYAVQSIKYAHMFILLRLYHQFPVDAFTHSLQGYFIGIGTIIGLANQYITQKHQQASQKPIVCI